MNDNTARRSPPARMTAVLRGIRGRCPRCGQGRLFHGYLRQIATCSSCAEPVGAIRAEDGPAWLTILITGPLVLPPIFLIPALSGWPDWLALAVSLVLAASVALALLPRVKGGFIGVLWLSKSAV